MGSAAVKTVTIEEYLSNPAYRHCEWVGGEVVELSVGTGKHGRIQARCASKLLGYLAQRPVGDVYVELHCKLGIGGATRYRLPDVCVKLGPEVDGHLEGAPEMCIEIRSPDDSVSDQIAKFADYFANGCQLGWLILPEEKAVLVLVPGAPAPRVARMGDALDGGSVLPGLEITVDSLVG
ncbi:MAG: Uma2 family endonuclease [Bryobacterales bacterium]|nr:Uma2 family endonuclease [Bryobacterales bacterium]